MHYNIEPLEIQVLTSTVTPAYCEDVLLEVLVLLLLKFENGSITYAWDNPGAFQQLTNSLVKGR